jgi:hypothetical protein
MYQPENATDNEYTLKLNAAADGPPDAFAAWCDRVEGFRHTGTRSECHSAFVAALEAKTGKVGCFDIRHDPPKELTPRQEWKRGNASATPSRTDDTPAPPRKSKR